MSRILFEFFSTDYTDPALVGGAAPVVFAPRAAAFVDPTLTGAPGVSAPGVLAFIDPALSGARLVFAPSFAAETIPDLVDPGVIGPGSAVFEPRVLGLVDPVFVGASSVFDLRVVSYLDPGLSGSAPDVFTPELFDWGFSLRGADGLVYARLAEGGLAHAPLLLEALRVRWAPGGEASGDLLVGGEARVRYARGGSSSGRS